MKHPKSFITLSALVVPALLAAAAQGGVLHRLAANYFGPGEIQTSTSAQSECNDRGEYCRPGNPDGEEFYEKTVEVPSGDNVLFVTISGTGDVHDDSALWLSCRIDGKFCNKVGGVAPAGWIPVLKLPTDEHDNSFYATWCIKVRPGKANEHEIALRLASEYEGKDVYFEQAHVYIDSTYLEGDDRCTEIEVEDGESGVSDSGDTDVIDIPDLR